MSRKTYRTAEPVAVIGRSSGEMPRADLRPGQAIFAEIGDAAKLGYSQEVWLAPEPLMVTARGNVRLDLREVRQRPDVRVWTDGTVTADYEPARLAYRRKGWLRVDPILGADALKMAQATEDEALEQQAAMKTPDFWREVAALNDVSFRPEWLASVPHASAAALMAHLRTYEPSEALTRTKAARAALLEWVEVIRAAGQPAEGVA